MKRVKFSTIQTALEHTLSLKKLVLCGREKSQDYNEIVYRLNLLEQNLQKIKECVDDGG